MIFDGHSDMWADVTIRRMNGESDILKNHHLKRLREGQMEGSIFVVWVDPPYDKDPRSRNLQTFEAVKKEMENNREFAIVRTYEEMMEARAAGKFYIFIGIEGMSGIGENLDLIDEFHDLGARHAMLTWNEQNGLGTGVQGDPERGLTAVGKKAVKKIMDKNMIMDVSHLNDKSFWDVMKLADRPIVASHSNARALCSALRNLSDQQLLSIRDMDGLVGLNSFNLFVDPKIENQTIGNLVKHAVYIADKIGVEHVGFGFDFFEFLSTDSMRSYSDQETSCTVGLEDCSKAPYFVELLGEAGFTREELELMKYKNWHRIIETIIG